MSSRTDELISKGMGKVKAAKAAVEGMRGVFRTLVDQHGQVAALLGRVERDPDRREELWPKIRQELLSHERGELRAIFPVLREYDETRALADQHERDAAELESQISRLQDTPIDSPEWGQLFGELVKLVERHVSDEESQIFPRAQDVMGDARARSLEASFEAAKQAALATA